MKQFLKHTASVLGFAAILLAILIALGPVLTPKNNTEEEGILSQRAFGYLAEPENTLDVMFFGDSEGYRAFVPLQMWEDYGITSFVCCTSGQQLYLTLDMMEQAFETQSPKYVFLETNILYRAARIQNRLAEAVYDVLPALRYHDHWKNLSLSDFTDEVHYTYIEAGKGYAYIDGAKATEEIDNMSADKSEKKMSSYSTKMFYKILDLCNEHGAQLVLISVPSTVNWSMKHHNHIAKLSKCLNLTYIDLNQYIDEIGIDWKTDSYDSGDHLNYSGAKKVSAYMGKYMHENMDLPDRRTNSEIAAEWNANLDEFKEFLQSST